MKKGFTLIELLAVIVILAIMALIATPIVLNIIEESRDNSNLRSAEMYLDAVEMSIATSTLNDKKIKDGTYNILENGNICLEYTDDECINELKVEVDGQTPTAGSTITISNGQITNTSLLLNNKTVVKNDKGELVYSNLKYTIGQEVTFDPGDGDRTWNVIGEDDKTITLMLTENLGDTVVWSSKDNNEYGPDLALNYLNTLTTNWNNVDPIESYSYINNLNGKPRQLGYQKIEINNGVTKLTHADGTTVTGVSGISKARILSSEEVIQIASKSNPNLTEENLRKYIERNLDEFNQKNGTNITTVDGVIDYYHNIYYLPTFSDYEILSFTVKHLKTESIEPTFDLSLPSYLTQNIYWTLSAFADGTHCAQYVSNKEVSYTYVGLTSFGIRPIITIPKSKL